MIRISRISGDLGNKILAKTAALLLGAAMVSVAGFVSADTIIPLQAGPDAVTASLGQVLSERGWNVTDEDDGSILLHPQQGSTEVVARQESGVDTRQRSGVPMIDAAYWQASLEPHGWGVEAAPDGSVVLIPGAVEVQSVAAAAPAASTQAEIPGQMGLTALRDRLSPHGWGVERDPQGSVLLIPGAAEVETAAAIPAASPQPELTDRIDLAWLRDRLSPHGWGVERDPDGSVVLTPGAVEVQIVAAVPSASSVPEAAGLAGRSG